MDALECRAERIERAAFESLHDNCPAAARKVLGLRFEQVADVLVAISENDPSILLNRALGLGTASVPSFATIERVVALYRGHGVSRFFLHVHPGEIPQQGRDWLVDAGLEKARGWRKFHRGTAPPARADTAFRIEKIGRRNAGEFGRIVCEAFDLTEAAVPLIASAARDERWRLFMSFDGDRPAGAGGLFIDDRCGWLGFGATSPAFRRRGSQGAIMAERIRTAIAEGCEHLFTETGEAAPGDPQHSYGNIERYGFEPGVLRENWTVRPS